MLVTTSEPLPERLPTARWEAFISAMRKAPVMLGLIPMETARAGTKMREAKASPVPSSMEPERFCRPSITAICVLLMVNLDIDKAWDGNTLFTNSSIGPNLQANENQGKYD
jgi:hypothetical protein